jgi:glyceraldehyde-3-phosphate dehydrogenase type I
MAKIKIGINGLGRIGRTILREAFNRSENDFEIVAANELGPYQQVTHLIKYDSVHGKFNGTVEGSEDGLTINGHKIAISKIADPSEIPWDKHGVEVVIDATGIFKDKASLGKHKRGSVKKVIMCAPGKDLDGTFVMGINNNTYDPANHDIISNGSCTTNCLAPIAKVLNDTWGIESGFMTTIHAYTSDQRILDAGHSDLRRSRAAALSMIPTTTGAAKAVGLVIPELKGKLDGYAIRVPTPNVSLVDLTANVKKTVTKEQVNAAMKEASEGALKGILGYSDEPLVSIDFFGSRFSSVFDPALTNVIGDTVKIVSWYDNEAGFSNRVIDLAKFIGSKF